MVELPYLYITNQQAYQRAVEHLQTFSRLALDLETYCKPEYRSIMPPSMWALDPHSGGISLLTLCGDDSLPYVFDILLLERAGYDPSPLVDLLKSREYLVAHNAKFELRFLFQTYGYWFENLHCTEVLATLLGNATGSKYGRSRGYSLAALLRDWFNLQLDGKGKEQVTDWYPRPTQRSNPEWLKKLRYAANDVRFLLALHDKLMAVLCRPLPTPETVHEPTTGYAQQKVIDLEMQMLVVSAQIEHWGLPCNTYLLSEFESALEDPYGGGELYRVASEILAEFGYHGEDSPMHDYPIPYKEQLQRLNNPEMLRNLLQKKINTLTTESADGFVLENAQRTSLQRLAEVCSAYTAIESGEAARIMFIDDEEEANYAFIAALSAESLESTSVLVNKILEYKKYAKQAGMHLSRYVHPLTGCIHAGFRQAYAATGRSASSNPNSQNINSRLKVEVSCGARDIIESAAQF